MGWGERGEEFWLQVLLQEVTTDRGHQHLFWTVSWGRGGESSRVTGAISEACPAEPLSPSLETFHPVSTALSRPASSSSGCRHPHPPGTYWDVTGGAGKK